MEKEIICPHCGKGFLRYANPTPTTDVIIYEPSLQSIVLIKRANPPYGYAIPGGFIDEGECAEVAAVREMNEETNLQVNLLGLLGVYSRPDRDPRQHTLSVVYVGRTDQPENLKAGDDAAEASFFHIKNLPKNLAFDHSRILEDFLDYLAGKRKLAPVSV